jgi:hypothetical protein
MSLKNFKFFQKPKQPVFQFRSAQMIATELVERVYDTGGYRNLRDLEPHQTEEGTYYVTSFNMSQEDNVIKIESNVTFRPVTPVTDITLNIEFTDHHRNINSL